MAGEENLVEAPSQFKDSFTVHNYTSLRSTSAESAGLLSSAQNLIRAGSSRYNRESWQDMREPAVILWAPKKLYLYNVAAPSDWGGTQNATPSLREWGVPFDEEEQWRLADLKDFESTDFSSVSMQVSTHNPPKRLYPGELQDEDHGPSAPKRRKLDFGSLHAVIARPHIYPSQQLSPSKAPAASLKPYKRTIPVILAPYADPLPQPSMYERRAWMIPIRGVLPWNGSSPAEMLHESESVPAAPAPRSLESIVWSQKALQEFWRFLSTLRSEGKLGTLGISFHASEVYKKTSIGIFSGGQNTGTRSSEVDPNGYESLLSSVDYIKVYHDAVKSMVLRTVFDVWAYQAQGEDGAMLDKIRVLKGAKLVLLDHLSRGMLIS